MEFEKRLPEELCEEYFQKMFGNIWKQYVLESIIFPNGFINSQAYTDFIKHNSDLRENEEPETEVHFLAGYFGNSLWEIFSNNHTVFSVDNHSEFSLGSWRGSGSFIASFIENQNKELWFDYLSFYMGHFKDEPEAKASYEFIFTQLKSNGFNWQYEYPHIGIIDFSSANKEDISAYNPNKALEEENNKNKFLKLIEEINAKRKKDIQTSSTPVVIIAYANVFGNYPLNWEG